MLWITRASSSEEQQVLTRRPRRTEVEVFSTGIQNGVRHEWEIAW